MPVTRVVLAAGAAFAVTNLDDLLLVTALFALARRDGPVGARRIVLGQYIGLGAVVAACLVIAAGLGRLPQRWFALFGVVPLALGVRGLVLAARGDGRRMDGADQATSVLGVAALTVSTSADNVGVWVPLLRQAGGDGVVVIVATFAALLAVWCLLAYLLAGHPRVVRVVDRVGHWLVPAVFVAVGGLVIFGLRR